MFDNIERVPGDAILGLIEAFKKDTNPQKVDLGVGVYKDDQGNTPVMRAVKEAEALLLKNETTKTYIGSHGAPAYGQAVLPLVLGEGSPVLETGRASATQSPAAPAPCAWRRTSSPSSFPARTSGSATRPGRTTSASSRPPA